MTVVFDKLAFVRRLETEDAFSRAQAEALSEALHTAVSETVATKADMAEIRHEMREQRVELVHEIGSLAVRMEHGNRELRAELKLWTGSLAAGLFAALSGLAVAMRFLSH
ncbi:MAG TPA: hypothetical protein VIK30_10020 [Polyangia bacterium]